MKLQRNMENGIWNKGKSLYLVAPHISYFLFHISTELGEVVS